MTITYGPVAANYTGFPNGSVVNGAVTFTSNLTVGQVALVTGAVPPIGDISAPIQAYIFNGVLQNAPHDTSSVMLLANTSDLNLASALQYTVSFEVAVNNQLVHVPGFTFNAPTPRSVTDGAITSGAATLTSATAVFASADVGASVLVAGAGPSGGNLFTTIVSVTNATTVVLAADAATTVSGANVEICRVLNLITVTPAAANSAIGLATIPITQVTGMGTIGLDIAEAVHAADVISLLGLGGGQDTYLGATASQAAMLALTGPEGSWTIRTDSTPNTVWYLTGTPPSSLSSWTELPTVPTVDVQTHAATSKATPVDADELPLADSAASFGLKKLTFANLKAWFKSYYDSVASALTNKDLTSGTNTFPTFNQNTTGTAANVTGTVAIGNGGTGQTGQQAAINALTGTQSAGKYLRSDGTNAALAAIQAADVPTLNQNTTGTAAGITGKTTPSGALVGTTDTQALTNKDLTGAGNAFPTLNQSTTGNAATATKLATARNINGVAFDGTANITVADSTKVPIDALTYDVLNHSVVADGVTDNTTAFATLVTAVVAAGGGTILFPPSTNPYLGSLVINANVPVKVLGYGATLQGPSGGTALTIDTGQTGGSAQTVMVEGLIIKGNADQTTDGVLIRDTSRARIVNCQIVRTNNAVHIQNYTSGQSSEGTTIRSTLINDCVTGVKMEIVSGGTSFDETILSDVGINNCTTGIYLPTSSQHVRSCFDATVWVGRASSTNGVAMYTDADMTNVWARLGGELYWGATSCAGVKAGSNCANSNLADLQLHFQGSVNPTVDLSSAGSGKLFMWRQGLANYAQSWSAAASNMLGAHNYAQGDTYPRSGFSLGSPTNAPMPGGQDGLFFGSGAAQADTVLFRPTWTTKTLSIGPGNCFMVGTVATGSRPSASTQGGGAFMGDSTLGRPIYGDGSAWHVLAAQCSGSASLTFPAVSAQSKQDLTITVTGANVGDPVVLGIPTAAITTGIEFQAWVSASNTITVRANNFTTGSLTPGSGTFKATVIQ